MTTFQPRNPEFRERTADSFGRQSFMKTIGARLTQVEPGRVRIDLDRDPGLCQQHGFFHGGVVGTVADNAGGYAAFSLLGEGDSILTVEYKLNLVAPARGERLIARGEVVRSGRTLIVCRSDVSVEEDGVEKPCATMLGTFMALHDRSDHPVGHRLTQDIG